MTRKKFMKMRREMARRIWLKQNGSLKGFGKSDKAMRNKGVDWKGLQAIEGFESVNSYEACWNSKPFLSIREMVGM